MSESVAAAALVAAAASSVVPAPVATPAPVAAAPAAPAAAPVVPAATPAAAAPAPTEKPAAPAKAEATTPAAVLEIELELPAGAEYRPEALKDFKSIFADDKLSSAQKAQAVLDLDLKYAAQNRKAFDDRVAAQLASDEAELKADKDFGGARFEKTVADARDVLTKTKHGPAVSKLLESAGLHKQPAIVKLLAEFRSLLSEDSTSQRVPGSQAAPDVKPPVTSQTQRLAQRYAKTDKTKTA